MPAVTCVLLGVAEVKLPLRRLPQNVRVRIANISHKAVLDPDPPEHEHSAELDEQRQSIGVVDGYYALSEVVVHLENGCCEVKRSQDVVLRHKARDVIVITPIRGCPSRVVYISRNDNFGRAAVVLQMKSVVDVEKLLSFFPDAVPESVGPALPSSEFHGQPPRDPKSSWSRGMGKKFTSMFASLTTANTQRKPSSLKASDRMAGTPESIESPSPTNEKFTLYSPGESSSDSEDDMETSADEADSQSEGKYYEEMGLDAKVQERLYEDSIETASRSSGSPMESNAYMIECEIRFFVESDEEFLKTLKSLEDDRRQLAGPDTPQFIRENLTLLFMQVKSLIRLHRDLHDEFKRSGYNIIHICEAIIRHHIDYESYIYFMENIPTVDKIIQNHADYFKAHMPNLPEKLRKPRMRLHYYVLTLETLHKKCSQSVEKQILHRAMEVLKIPLKRADSKLFLGAVTGSPFDVNDLGNLIRHSDLHLRKGGDLPRRNYHVLVLKSLLILTISRGRNYQYITSFRMDQVGLGKQERGVMFSLHVRNGPRGSSVHYVFKAKNISIQQQWISTLRDILTDKTQPESPIDKLIEDELPLGRRSKVRRGQSFEKTAKKFSQATNSDSEEVEEERHHLGRSVSDGSAFSGRRAAVKKSNSSVSGSRNRPMLKQQSSNVVNTNRSSVNWKNLDKLPPLKVESVFPRLKDVFRCPQVPCECKESCDTQIFNLMGHDDTYIAGLNDQLGTFLSDDFSKPPQCIVAHMRRLYTFHYSYFSPFLERACHTSIPEEVAKCFTENAEEFTEIYSNFIADRVRYDAQMQEMDLRNDYVYPILHFELYVKTLRRLKKHAFGVSSSLIEEAIEVLYRCVTNANTILLTETICGAPFDLDECGPILYDGIIKVRRAGMLMRQEMYVVLLNSLILMLEPRIPCYNYVDAIRMDTVGMGPSADSNSFQLEVRTEATKTVTYSFRAQDKESKRDWEQQITNILSKQVELLKERLKKRLGNEQVNMKHIAKSDNTNLHHVNVNVDDMRTRIVPLETSL